jgi:hypothetical protein
VDPEVLAYPVAARYPEGLALDVIDVPLRDSRLEYVLNTSFTDFEVAVGCGLG